MAEHQDIAAERRFKRFLTAGELADMISVRASWVYRAKKVMGMPFYQIGVYVRFDPDEIMQWLEESRTKDD